MKWPSADACSVCSKAATSIICVAAEARASGAVRIHVEHLVAPGQPLGLDLEPVVVAMAMTVSRHFRPDGNHAVFEAGLLAAGRRREDDVPHMSIRTNLHRRMWAGEAHRRFNDAGDFELCVEIAAPAVVGADRAR